MNILELRALRGPNRYSRYPAIFMLLDIGALEERPSDALPGFPDRLLERLPGLNQHRCSLGVPGGFAERLRRGTWAGHIVEHVAIELQCMAGMEVGFGKTRSTRDKGVYEVAFRYRVEAAGLQAAKLAVDLVAAAIDGRYFDTEAGIAGLIALREADRFGPSTQSIVDEARRRGIPVQRLNEASLVQLGHGARQRRIQATVTDRTTLLGAELADDKFATKALLRQAGIPVPEGEIVTTAEACRQAAEAIGFPIAVKPKVGNHGRGITARIDTLTGIEAAFAAAAAICPEVVVERSLSGADYRVLVINHQLAAAARRDPAHVVGDGETTIRTLIDRVNADPRRGAGHEKVMTRIEVDALSLQLLRRQGLGLEDVPAAGEVVALKSTANLSTGGTATDVTDRVHPQVRFMCERIARLSGLDCVGIDIVAPSLDAPLDPELAGVVEINAAPGFRMHLEPSEGTPRNVAAPFVEMLFPPEQDFSLPIVAVTGTNGKTTTARLIAHALRQAGRKVGFAGTTGVEIDGHEIVAGDYSGPEGAGLVLHEPLVDQAVLEVARGGILRRGLGFSQCDVGVFLNVAEDHLGFDGVHDLETLAWVKATVIEVVKPTGVAVLNADDPVVVGLQARTPGRILYVSRRRDNPVIQGHLLAGGSAVVQAGQDVLLLSPEGERRLLGVSEAPITMQGKVGFNIANLLAAAAALLGLGLPDEAIRQGLCSFEASADHNPGRMNLLEFGPYKILLDYGHNVAAVQALGEALSELGSGRRLVLAHAPGNRLDSALQDFGAALAAVYDQLILADPAPRGRAPGEITGLISPGARWQGLPADALEVIPDLTQALDATLARLRPGDLLVVQVDDFEPLIRQIRAHFEARLPIAAKPSPKPGRKQSRQLLSR